MRSTIFANNEYFHVFNRGVDKRVIFQDRADYQRFLLGLREFNTMERIFHLKNFETKLQENKQPLVEIVAYCLMPNHFHLLLKQVTDGGVSKFLHKLLIGYTQYFNKRYERSGVLFQGTFKAKHVQNNIYLLHLSRYIHLNCLELFEPNWKKIGINNLAETQSLLKNYEWSSYKYYVEQEMSKLPLFPIQNKIVLNQINNYEKFSLSWTVKDLTLLNSSKLLMA